MQWSQRYVTKYFAGGRGCDGCPTTDTFGIYRQQRHYRETYNLWLTLRSSNGHLAGPKGQLNIFWRLLAANRYLAGTSDQLKIIVRSKAANIQFWYFRFEKSYMTAAR